MRGGLVFALLVTVFLAAIAVSSALAADYYVDANSGDDSNDGSQGAPWKTITHALDVVEGTEADPVSLQVLAGTYAASTNGETFPLNMKSWVSLFGEDQETTILDAEQNGTGVINCISAEGVTIDGFTITGGESEDSGAGVLCSECSPTISNDTIIDNATLFNGGGIHVWQGSPVIVDNIVANNSAPTQGAGICTVCGPGCSPSIEHNTIFNNGMSAQGGGISCSGAGSATITDNIIAGNITCDGGGIYCADLTSVTISNNTISNNIVDNPVEKLGKGGGITINMWDSVSIIITNNTITNNESSYVCGAIHGQGDFALVANNRISGNRALNGILSWSGISEDYSVVIT